MVETNVVYYGVKVHVVLICITGDLSPVDCPKRVCAKYQYRLSLVGVGLQVFKYLLFCHVHWLDVIVAQGVRGLDMLKHRFYIRLLGSYFH